MQNDEESPSETESVEIDASALPAEPPEHVSADGQTTTILLDGNEPAQSAEWDENLATAMDEANLDELARKYLNLIEQDRDDREERDQMQADGLKKAGIGEPAPGGATFEGASSVTHPGLMEAYIDFASSAMKELWPPNGPVRANIQGKPDKAKTEKAKRKAAFMNWQLTHQIKNYRAELEILLTQLPVGGSQYMKLFWDKAKQRPNVEFISIDEMVLPYEAHSFYSVQRKFHRISMSEDEYQRRVQSGEYMDLSLPNTGGIDFDKSESKKQQEKIEGKRDNYTSDANERIIYEGVVLEELGDDKAPEGKPCPYFITIDEQNSKVLAVYRDWDEDSKTQEEVDYIVDFNFIPWDGVFGLSLLQCLAGLPDAATGALRALLDSALIANMPGGLKLKSSQSGASLSTSPTQMTEVDALGQDDIRKVYMPIPFNPPSNVLFQLLGFLSSSLKEVVGTAEEKISEASNQMPVGTALALIEQGAKVFSAIHARLHDSQRRCLEVLHRLNRDHLPERFEWGTDPDDYVLRSDFEGIIDVYPVSDPNIFSETQRFAQVQFILQALTQTAAVLPQVAQLFKMRELFARAFDIAKIPNYEEFLPPVEDAEPVNPADENINMVMGKPVKAFPGQNTEAHIQVLLDFAQNPILGKSPIIMQKFAPQALNHLQDHLLVWYVETMKKAAAHELGKKSDEIDWDKDPDAAIGMAKACATVDQASQIAFGKIPALVQQAMQLLQQMAPKPPIDPMVAVEQAKVSGNQEIEKGKLSLAQQKQQSDDEAKVHILQEKLQAAQRDYDLAMQQAGLQSQTAIETANINAGAQVRSANINAQTEMARTVHDNASAQKIAEMKIASDEKTKLSTGASLSET